MNKTLYLRKIAPLCCGVALLASCSSKETSTPAVVMPSTNTSTNTNTYVAPVTPNVTTPDTGIEEDAVSEATVSVERNEMELNIGLTTGAGALGAARMIADNESGNSANYYNMTMLYNKSDAKAFLAQELTHIATMSSMAALEYYNENPDISVLAVNSYSDLYLMEKGNTIQSMSDLAGKTIWASGGGTESQVILTLELEAAGLVVGTDVFVEYMSAEDVRSKMLWNDTGYGLLAVPDCTKLVMEDENIRQAINVGEGYPMHCLVVKHGLIEENETQVSHFLLDYQISLAYMQSGEDDLGDMVIALGEASNSAAAFQAVSDANLTCLVGSGMKSSLQTYYSLIYAADPSLIAGGLPYDDFYYGA